jgi:hypothetical protein
VGSHKANLNNPNTSEESKQNSKQALENDFSDDKGKHQSLGLFQDQMLTCYPITGETGETESKSSNGDQEKNLNNVAGGLKAEVSPSN